jgi:hypothetical protein
MESSGMNAVALLVEAIKEHVPEDIWQGSPLLGYRNLGNTKRGAIGEEFVRRHLQSAGVDVGSRTRRTAITDMQIGGRRFEIKTASLGANGAFQFNHVRLDRNYEYLLCLGICPDKIVFKIWRKGAVAEGRAGRLVRMAEGQAVTWKLTKQVSSMESIEALPDAIKSLAKTSK